MSRFRGWLARARDSASRISRAGPGAALAIAVFLAAFNMAAQLFYFRIDFSQGRIYSPSPATKRLLKSLEDPVIVKGYFSRDLPQPYATYRNYLKDLLKAYRNYGGKNLEFNFVEHSDDQKFRSEAMSMGVAPVRLTYIAKDKYEIKDGFMGLVMLHGDRKETIPVLRDMNGLEYDLTSRIKKLTSKEIPVVGILTGHGARVLSPEITQAIEENYSIKEYGVEDLPPKGKQPSSLLVIGPRERFSDGDVARVEQTVLAGVPAGFFLDTKNVNMESGGFFASPLDTKLERLPASWGLAVQKGYALDAQNQNISIQQRAGPFLINNIVSYPLMPVITNLSQDSPITKGLDQVVLPFASPIATESVKNLTLEVLATTTRLSWMKTEVTSLSPLADVAPGPQDRRGPFVVAAAVHGSFSALFPAAPDSIAKSTPPAAGWLAQSKGPGRVFLTGTSVLLDPNMPTGESNTAFFLNAVDWLSQDADLIAVRSKGVRLRPLKRRLGVWGRQAVKFAAIFLMPLGVVGAGALRWRRRRAWKAGVRQRVLAQQIYP